MGYVTGTQTRVARLRRLFGYNPKDLYDVRIARLCVLYEDLRIELLGTAADSIVALDALEPADEYADDRRKVGFTRKHYFLRRSIGTLAEFAEALAHLDASAHFRRRQAFWKNERAVQEWDEAMAFFHSKRRLITNIRNGIGGHFGDRAAIYAVEHVDDTTGKMQFVWKEQGRKVDVQFHFATTLAVTSFVRHLPCNTSEERVEYGFQEVLLPAFKHATNCVKMLGAVDLWQRFERG